MLQVSLDSLDFISTVSLPSSLDIVAKVLAYSHHRHIEVYHSIGDGPQKRLHLDTAIRAFSEFWFGPCAHFFIPVFKTSIRFGMFRISYYTQPALHWGSCQAGCLYPHPPKKTIQKDQSSPKRFFT